MTYCILFTYCTSLIRDIYCGLDVLFETCVAKKFVDDDDDDDDDDCIKYFRRHSERYIVFSRDCFLVFYSVTVSAY